MQAKIPTAINLQDTEKESIEKFIFWWRLLLMDLSNPLLYISLQGIPSWMKQPSCLQENGNSQKKRIIQTGSAGKSFALDSILLCGQDPIKSILISRRKQLFAIFLLKFRQLGMWNPRLSISPLVMPSLIDWLSTPLKDGNYIQQKRGNTPSNQKLLFLFSFT